MGRGPAIKPERSESSKDMTNIDKKSNLTTTPKAAQTAAGDKQHKARETVKPVKRGFVGHFFYHLGMFLTRHMIKLECRGCENIPQGMPYLLAANHETYVDGMWIASFLPPHHFPHFASLAAQDLLSDHGWFGKVIMHVGRGVPLNRKGSPARGLILAKQQIDNGNILLVHPEGTRSHDGRLGEFENGACYLAQKANVPLVPVFIDGGYEVFNRYMTWPKGKDPKTGQKRRVIINYGQPLLPANFKSPKAMTEALSAWMHHMFENKVVPRDFSSLPKPV